MEDSSAIESALLNIKPLRDLAQNWDIDIASCLQDYLAELGQVGHPVPHSVLPLSLLEEEEMGGTTADNGSKTNFAQAALLLQNSSFVYSRKVEYLYSLVYSALNELIASTANNNKNETGKKNKSVDKDLEEFEAFDPQLEFLLLDDVLPTDETGDKINLKHARTADESYFHRDGTVDTAYRTLDNRRERHYGLADTVHSRLNTTLRSSLGNNSMSLSRVEPSFVDIVTGGAGTGGASGPAALLYSSSARAALEAIMSAACNNGGTGNAAVTQEGSLRLLHGACDMDDRGTLLIPGSSIPSMYQDSTRLDDNNILHSRFALVANAKDTTTSQNGMVQQSQGAGAMDEEYDHGGGFGNNNHDDDGSVDGPAFQFHGDSTSPNDMQMVDEPPSSTLSPRNLRNRKQVQDTHHHPEEQKVLNDDPWLMMDPHDPSSSKPCPIRIGMTYKLPSGVEELPSETVTGARTKTSKRTAKTSQKDQVEKIAKTVDYVSMATFDSILSYCEQWMHAPSSTGDSNHADSKDPTNVELFTIPKKGLIFGDEFSYIIEAKKKLFKEQQTKARKGIELQKETVEEKYNHEDMMDNDHDDDIGGGFGMDYGGDDDDNDIDEHAAAMDGADVNISLHQFNEVFGSDDAASVDDDKHNYLSFDELCRAHLKEFKEGARRFAVETQLSKRVSLWQDRLASILDEEEKRPEFNIQSYGKKILNKVQTTLVPCEAKVCIYTLR